MDSKIQHPGGAADDDVISRLPDDVLLRILTFLPTDDAVRTRALSRRWRHVWLCLADLVFSDIGKTCWSAGPGLPELVDAALAHSHETLKIRLHHPFHIARANEWLQQAAERVHGKISLKLDQRYQGQGNVVLDFPSGGGARTAAMSFRSSIDEATTSILRLPAAPAVNSSLRVLKLKLIRLEGGSLSDLLSSCVQLRTLRIDFVWIMDGQDLRISNKLLEELDLDYILGGRVGRLEVSCPKLRLLRMKRLFVDLRNWEKKMVASFCTPCLEEIDWPLSGLILKSRVEFLGSMDTVRRLTVGLHTHVETNESHLGHWLLRSCTGVQRLTVSLMNRTKDYPNLVVTHLIVTTKTCSELHMFGASIAELLSKCCQLQRLDVCADYPWVSDMCPTDCPCKRPLNWSKRKLRLDFLKHVEISYYNSDNYKVDWIDDLIILLRLSSKAIVKMPEQT